MPRREDIDKFREILNSLGGEPEIMAQRAQTIEEVAPPEEVQLPGAVESPAAEEPSPAQDFGLDLTSLPDIEGEAAAAPEQPEAAPSPPEPPPEGEAADLAGLDFSSLFGEETAAPPIQEVETPPTGDEFQLPESESESLQSDLAQMEVVPEEPQEQPAAPEAEPSPFGDIGSFEPESAEPAAPPESELSGLELPPAPPSEEELAGIELPNLEDLSLGEPSAGTEEPGQEPLPSEALGSEAPGSEALPSEALSGLESPPSAPESIAPAEAEAFEAPLPSLDEEIAGGAPQPSEAPAEPSPESLGEEGLADLGLDQLSFPEAPAEEREAVAQVPEEKAPRAARPAPPRPPAPEPEHEEGPAARGGPEEEISLTPEQFASVRATLESLPRNLKILVQDVIADGRAAGAELSRLVSLLVAGATAREIAAVVGRITGSRVRIPEGYEKRSGVAFEAERRTFAYAFRENIVPLIRVFALTILAAAIIGFLGYRYVYRPLYATASYRVGYTHIMGDRYTLANESFDRATRVWPIKRWYYRYAEAFEEHRQYVLAEQKYDQLLATPAWRDDRKAILDYARMESTKLADYTKADGLLKILLTKNQYDFDALLASGDNNLEWAAIDKSRFEPARVAYASLIEKYGGQDMLLFRMMRYFIRTDNAQEIERLRVYFASREGLKVDPFVYAELGGYLVDHRRLNYVKEILFKADAAKSELPEIHYNLARYYRLVDLQPDELLALQATMRRMKASDPLTPKRLTMEIDTHARLGELYDSRGEYINGERELHTAIALIEENQKNRLIGTGPIFGRAYADLGDLNYYVVGDMAAARDLYQKATANSYFDPALDFKIGYTQYAAGDYLDALSSFMKTESEWGYPRDQDAPPQLGAAGPVPVDYTGKAPANLLYTLGNCFYQRGDFFASQGYYLRLLDRLQTRQAAIGTLEPGDKPEHRSLLETLVKVNNNLGVAMDRLAARTGDRTKRSQALVYLASASQIADTLTRTPGPGGDVGAKNLPYLNQRGILYPVSGFVPQIATAIPRDLGSLTW